MKTQKNRSGFAIIEVALTVLVVALIAFAGWWVYNRNHKDDTSSTQTNSQQSTGGNLSENSVPKPTNVSDLKNLQSTLDNASLGDTSVSDLNNQLDF